LSSYKFEYAEHDFWPERIFSLNGNIISFFGAVLSYLMFMVLEMTA